MLICWAKKRGLSILAIPLFALLAIAMFPEVANAHGAPDLTPVVSENKTYVDTDLAIDPARASSHCHSVSGQDCSTQIAFLITSGTITNMASFDVSTAFYNTLSTGLLLSFDPPPPRVLS